MKSANPMIEKLFFKMLPVYVLIVAMVSINSIVDGIVAGRFIDSATVGVIGLFGSIAGAINAVSSVILGGSSVLSGRFMGSGDLNRTRGIFSLNITLSVGLGVILTVIGLLFSGTVADICGANEALRGSLSTYIFGYSIGIVPLILTQQLAAFLQLERQSLRNYIGIGAMIVCNVTLDIVLVSVFDMGIFGLALSTSLCNWVYLLVLVSYYFGGKAQLVYTPAAMQAKEILDIVKIGFPGALLVFCLSARNLVLNRLVLLHGGQEGLSAKGALEMASGLFIAFCLGGGQAIRALASVYEGEEDRDSIKEIIRLSFTKLMAITLVITALIVVFSGNLASIFFADTGSVVHLYTRQFFLIFGASIPLILMVQIETNYLQAGQHNICVDVSSVIDGFFSVIIPAVILGPVLGVLGLWLATPIGIIFTSLIYPIYAIIYNRHIPKNVDEWLLFKKDFGVSKENRLILNIRSLADVSETSEKVHNFCREKGVSEKTALYSALCLEEMSRNIVVHGFEIDNKKHSVDARAIYKDGEMMLRIKDDCIPFDPVERASQVTPDDPTKNIGLRMVTRLASHADYQNLLGLNVLTIKLK